VKKFWGLLIFNSAFACACIFLFSPGFAGLSPGSDKAYKVILFFVAVLGLLAAFIYINSAILAGKRPSKKVKLVDSTELETSKDYIKALQGYLYKKDFESQIKIMIDQIKRISPKKASLEVILAQSFDKSEMTYIKFQTTLNEVMNLFYDNTKKAINRIGVFDENEYRMLMNNALSLPEDSRRLKIKIYREHIEYVNAITRRNEYIITLVDNLILEISKLEDLNSQSAENIEILNEMKRLIDNTKYYA